jgi:hypothetical protein
MHAATHWPVLELRDGRHISRILRAQCLHANNNPPWFLQLRLLKFPPDVPHAREGLRTCRVRFGRRRVQLILRLLPQPYCDEAAEAAQEGLRLHVAQHVDGRRAQRLVLVRCLRQRRKGLLVLGAVERARVKGQCQASGEAGTQQAPSLGMRAATSVPGTPPALAQAKDNVPLL